MILLQWKVAISTILREFLSESCVCMIEEGIKIKKSFEMDVKKHKIEMSLESNHDGRPLTSIRNLREKMMM